MQYAFVIDQRKCIGCHACTVACKAENEVPLGQFRTWVKYVEKGTFPTVRRHFTVLRCNHCDAAPCVEICPVEALHKRPDAIVDLDRDLCIGCRACMQACPYDALYLNDSTGTAEKCHYCAHRTELGLEPACVIVCPVHAIVAGDMANPESEIATLRREQPTSQRRLEKGTQPRVWYVDALPEALVPGSAAEPIQYLWSDRLSPPPVYPGFEPPSDLLTALDVPHPPVWGWHIWSYLMTKNVAAGVMIAAPLLSFAKVGGTAGGYVPEILGLLFLTITTVLLVHDLGRPERFLKIIFHPNTKSWLVKGAWVLMGFGLLTTLSLAARFFGRDQAADLLRWANLPFAVLASGYTAFLLAQCKGRDLWLEKSLFAHLIVRAALLGAGVAVLLPGAAAHKGALLSYLGLVAANFLWLLLDKSGGPHSTDGKKAHALLWAKKPTRKALAALGVATLLAAAMPFAGGAAILLGAASFALAIAGLFLFEKEWIKAGQEVPNS